MKVVVADRTWCRIASGSRPRCPPGVGGAGTSAPDPRRCWTICATPTSTSAARFTADMADAAEKLRLIHAAGAGTDKVDFAALPPDILVANTFHHEQSIAEYVVAAAVMLRRDFLLQDRALRPGCGPHRCTTTPSRNRAPCGARGSASSASATSASGPGTCCARSAAPAPPSRAPAGWTPDAHGLAWAGDTTDSDRLLRESRRRRGLRAADRGHRRA